MKTQNASSIKIIPNYTKYRPLLPKNHLPSNITHILFAYFSFLPPELSSIYFIGCFTNLLLHPLQRLHDDFVSHNYFFSVTFFAFSLLNTYPCFPFKERNLSNSNTEFIPSYKSYKPMENAHSLKFTEHLFARYRFIKMKLPELQ